MRKLGVVSFLMGALFLFGNQCEAQQGSSSFQKYALSFRNNCGKCHTIGRGDRVGPDLKGMTSRRDRDWLAKFIMKPSDFLDSDPVAIDLLKKYNDVRMEDLGLSRDEAEGLIDYVQAMSIGSIGEQTTFVPLEEEDLLEKIKGPDERTDLSLLWVGIGALFLIGAILAFKFSLVPLAVILIFVSLVSIYLGLGGRQNYVLWGIQQGYEPDQPINFSHELHAGKMEISCLYCHSGAEKGPVAGVPDVATCIKCHKVVKKRSGQEEPSKEIQKIVDIWESQKSTAPALAEWIRVHSNPNFVYFNHKTHVKNGISCQKCHGPVQTMKKIRQASDLSMGSCLECHRNTHKDAPMHWKRSKGPMDCAACHW